MTIHRNSQVITSDDCGEMDWADAGMVQGDHIAECGNCQATVVDKVDE